MEKQRKFPLQSIQDYKLYLFQIKERQTYNDLTIKSNGWESTVTIQTKEINNVSIFSLNLNQ